ncbi:MAG: hypothetical protein K8I60_00950, partial [Anaerolineae bacterium]|nr:hypothetical protein [Anaerolineae bacterium]
MHILHGTWEPTSKRFVLWGENAVEVPSPHKGKRAPIEGHPFALSWDDMLKHLTAYSTDANPEGGDRIIWLPGNNKKAQPSPEAQTGGMPPLSDDLALLGWQAPVLVLRPADFLDFALQLPQRPRGCMVGSDLVYWQGVALLAMTCLVEGRYIPALWHYRENYYAYWEARPDRDALAQMAANMPPLCRAVTPQPDQAEHPYTLLEGFLHNAVDSFVREYHQQRKRPLHPWLQALTGDDSLLKGSSVQNHNLYEAWQAWQAMSGASGAFRVCFRLSEPQDDRDVWLLEY